MLEVSRDKAVTREIAHLICGGDSTVGYRRVFEIEEFFSDLGVKGLPPCDGPRIPWVVDFLDQISSRPCVLTRVVLRLADPREYIDDHEAHQEAVSVLNRLLALDDQQIINYDKNPELVRLDERSCDLSSSEMLELKTHPGDVLSHAPAVDIIEDRVREARLCVDAQAYVASVVLIGGALEMILLYFARDRGESLKSVPLQALIKLASERGWVRPDLIKYADVVREHRNIVHPDNQLRNALSPNKHNVIISWNILAAVLDDLAEFSLRPASSARF